MFAPFVPNVGSTSPSGMVVTFGSIDDLREALEVDGERIAAFMIEPIQGAAGLVNVLDQVSNDSNFMTLELWYPPKDI